MAVKLEPVYAVLLAIPILGEQHELGALFYLDVVVAAVMSEPLLQWLRAAGRGPPAVSEGRARRARAVWHSEACCPGNGASRVPGPLPCGKASWLISSVA